ncbi:MAG: hypothetical protein KAI79_00125 [Bacteroidales bacterium]|nr:hypothetical protein [Bacteroidales bacterium]
MKASVLENNVFWGNIFKTHGVKGEVLIKVEQDLIENIQNLQLVFLILEGKPVPFFLDSSFSRWKSDEYAYLKFVEVNSIEEVQELLFAPVHIPDKFSQIKVDSISSFVYLNFVLKNKKGKTIGKIVDWMDIQNNPVLTLDCDGVEVLIPFVEDWIIDTDSENKVLQMDFPPDLLKLQ